jgi:MEMO1 family protein
LILTMAFAGSCAHSLYPVQTGSSLRREESGCTEETGFQYAIESDKADLYLNAAEQSQPMVIEGPVPFGGIVSHHLLASRQIAGFFAALKKVRGPGSANPIRRFVILGPDHHSVGSPEIKVSMLPYKTPFGFVEPDPAGVNHLISTGAVTRDESTFRGEHSIGALVAFIKYYFPDAKLLPIILHYRLEPEDTDQLDNILKEILDKDDFLLVSSDFVHGKNQKETDRLDEINKEILLDYTGRREPADFIELQSDCRKCVRILFRRVSDSGEQKSGRARILYHTSSHRLGGGAASQGTSYFFAVY